MAIWKPKKGISKIVWNGRKKKTLVFRARKPKRKEEKRLIRRAAKRLTIEEKTTEIARLALNEIKTNGKWFRAANHAMTLFKARQRASQSKNQYTATQERYFVLERLLKKVPEINEWLLKTGNPRLQLEDTEWFDIMAGK